MSNIRVFICMPYGDDNTLEQREHNTKAAMGVFHALADAGFYPICPHLSHYLHEMKNRPRSFWLTHSMLQLDTCDCLLVMHNQDGPSEGMQMEIKRAHQNGQPVFDMFGALQRAFGMPEEL